MTINNMATINMMQRTLGINQTGTAQQLNRLSSGLRINSAADDAAGLAVSQRMRGQVGGLSRASENVQSAVNLIQIADGGINSSQGVLGRMRELAVQASNGMLSDGDRAAIGVEFEQLQTELDRISSSTDFGGIPLLGGQFGGTVGPAGVAEMGVDSITSTGVGGTARFEIAIQDGVTSITANAFGQSLTQQLAAGDTGVTFDFGGGQSVTLGFNDAADLQQGTISNVQMAPGGGQAGIASAVSVGENDTGGLSFQIGANPGQQATLSISNMSAAGIGVAGLNLSTAEGAAGAVAAIDSAIAATSGERASLGALQNRMESAVSTLGVFRENTQASQSGLSDADMAAGIMEFTRQQMMVQASLTMMAQNNNLTQSNMMQLLVR